MSKIEARTTCRVCGSSNLTKLFSLGNQYVSTFTDHNRFLNSDIPYCPIELEICQNCTLIQQKYTAPSEFMYTRHYWYRSGVTQTMKNALKDIVDSSIKRVKLEENDIALDIGSNDGELLRQYKSHSNWIRTVGVEPAINLQQEGSVGITALVKDFWNEENYLNTVSNFDKTVESRKHIKIKDWPQSKAKIITAIGMFYDLDDPNAFIADIAKVLHPEGIFICQLMCAKQMYEQKDVGNLAHEHLEFYSLNSLEYLFYKNGLTIGDIEENDVNGGSYRIYAYPIGSKLITKEGKERCRQALDIERDMRIRYEDVWAEWFQDIMDSKAKLYKWVRYNVLATENLMYVYGASTKGNVLLQWWGLQNGIHVHGAADKSVEKHGKYTVGTGIYIYSEDDMRQINPKYLLVLPYSFINEFIERERTWMERGGIFLVPLPTLRTYQLVDSQVKETIL